ncbi:MAG: hypothetical protein MUE81_07135 [Thermoflexibacter sp.]|nr:hypothetical protein [Thermoflexibacter sp.]
MKVCELTLLWSLLFIFLSSAIIAQDLLIFKDKKKPVEIAKYVSIYEDSTNGLSINSILSSEIQSQFIKMDKSVLSLGFSQSSFWLKCSFVHNGTEDLVLQIKNVLLDSIQVYLIDNDSIVSYKQAGLLMPYSDRDINTNYYIFNLSITSKSIYDLYLYWRKFEERKKIYQSNHYFAREYHALFSKRWLYRPE